MGLNGKPEPAVSLGICAVLSSAVGFNFGTGLQPHWWLTWLAPIPVLLFAYKASRSHAFLAAFAAFLLGVFTYWNYFRILHLPIPVRVLAFVGPSCVFAFGVLRSRQFFLRGNRILAVLALPVVWTSFEYLISLGANGTALNIAYSQMNFLPALQVVSVTGIWGLDFLLFLIPSLAATIITAREPATRFQLTFATILILVVVMGFREWRLRRTPTGEQVIIGLASTDQRPLMADNEADASAIVRAYSDAIDHLAAQGAQVIVIPEKIASVSSYESGIVADALRSAAQRNRVLVVVGVDRPDRPLKHNIAIAFSPQGALEAVYEKHFMVPGWEDGYERGTRVAMLPKQHSNWGVAICKDMDFPALSRRYAAQHAQLMLVPAWDFTVDDWLHGRMAILRGVESGFAIARSAKQGLMTISDDRGRVLAQQGSSAASTSMLIGTITLSTDRTLYSRLGDWFAWFNLGLLVVVLVLPIVRRQL